MQAMRYLSFCYGQSRTLTLSGMETNMNDQFLWSSEGERVASTYDAVQLWAHYAHTTIKMIKESKDHILFTVIEDGFTYKCRYVSNVDVAEYRVYTTSETFQ
jgi:hypothetical protein